MLTGKKLISRSRFSSCRNIVCVYVFVLHKEYWIFFYIKQSPITTVQMMLNQMIFFNTCNNNWMFNIVTLLSFSLTINHLSFYSHWILRHSRFIHHLPSKSAVFWCQTEKVEFQQGDTHDSALLFLIVCSIQKHHNDYDGVFNLQNRRIGIMYSSWEMNLQSMFRDFNPGYV